MRPAYGRAPDLIGSLRGVPRWWRLAALMVLAGLALFAVDRWRDRPVPSAAAAAPADDPRDYAAALVAADRAVARAPNRPALAGALLRRARLTGSFDDLARADAVAATLAGGGTALRQAALAVARGDFAAPGTATGQQARATTALQHGAVALGAGHWPQAASYFAEAEQVFPGWWLVAAHRAQMLALQGDLEGANRAYRAIIGRTATADPVVMDALAALCFERGDLPDGRLWAAQAAAVWERRLLTWPAASLARAAEHELAVGDPVRALDLARRNLAAWPGRDAQLLLARAQLADGKAAEAVATIAALEAGGGRTAAQYVVLADALAVLDRGEESEAARQAALAINPKALDTPASLLWFGAD
ncbi:hypothetical protein [Sandarakinorhabdus sp. DWP1-3-1]|uniref:hypothetical protein n=1 Tax=Sandarakinorhabdus sp. DWP1-3-1 TaxID=2804627 RepID=UPI003CF386AA